MIIEMLGAPGAGKTTTVPLVAQQCREAGLTPYTVESAARPFAARTRLGRVLAAVTPRRQRARVLWVAFRLVRAAHAVRMVLRHRALARYVARSQWRRPPEADARQRRILSWYIRSLGSLGLMQAHVRPDEVVIIDEGPCHRAVQLLSSSVEVPSEAQVRAYAALVPRSGPVVHVRAPGDVCRRRVRERGVWSRLAHRSDDEVDRFVTNAHQTSVLMRAALDRLGFTVVDVDNSGCGPTVPALAESVLCAGRSTAATATSPPARVPRLVVPKPTRLAGAIQARLHPPRIGSAEAAAILDRFGLELDGEPASLSMSWRHEIALVPTTTGRKVLKRYRAASTLEMIHHEHAIIGELEVRGFPATRLNRTPEGESVVETDGRHHAVFDFQPGRQFASALVTDRQRGALLHIAGATLGGFHATLEGYVPPGRHRLGIDPGTSERCRGLEWHLDALDGLAGSGLPREQDARDLVHDLQRQTVSIRSSLEELGNRTAVLDLPRTVIHGDYGTHNLIYRSDGTAVVHDLELSRHDWRLLDIVIAFMRLSPRHRSTFIEGYRTTNELPDDELAHFPDLWRYHLVTGAVRSWWGYEEFGGARRLVTAQSRLADATAHPPRVGAR